MSYKCRKCQTEIERRGLCDDCHRRVMGETRRASDKQYVETREKNASQSRSAINTLLGPTVLAPAMSSVAVMATVILFSTTYSNNLLAVLTLSAFFACLVALFASFGIILIGLLVENPMLAIVGLFMCGLPFFLYGSKGDPQFEHARIVFGVAFLASAVFLFLYLAT